MERWEVIDAVQKMQDYIKEHIDDNINMEDLARNSGYSKRQRYLSIILALFQMVVIALN